MSPLLKKRSKTDERYLLMKYCCIAGVLAFLVMMFTYACHDNTLTLGKNTVLRMDLYHQYGPLYAELYDRIVNGYSLVYSWTSGLGGAFLGNLFNYCCSPFALSILLLGHENMPEAIAVMILLNAVAAAMTFTYYINKTSESVNRVSIGFGLLYAFSGYFVAYSWNIMWLDAMAAFPLVMLGIEKIIQKNKPSLYIFAMTFTMITNYYMAYMVCILSVLWFLYYFCSRYEFSSPMFRPKAPAPEPEQPFGVTADGFEIITQPAPPMERAANDAAAEEAAVASAVTEEAAAIDAAINAAVLAGNGEQYVRVTDQSSALSFTESGEAASQTDDAAQAASSAGPTGEISDPVIAETQGAPVADNPMEAAVQTANAASSAEALPSGFAYNAPESAVDKKGRGAKDKKDRRKLVDTRFWVAGWSFALSSLLCFLLAAFALLPVYYCLQTSSATGGTLPTTLKVYFNLFDYAANHLPSLTTTIRSSGDIILPNIYCGLLTVMLIPLFFFSKRVTGRKKVAAVILLGVFYLSFSINYFNFFWHGMHMPNDLPFRYSFGYSFLLLVIAYEVLRNLDEFSNRFYVGVGVGVIAYTMLLDDLTSPNVARKTIVMTLVFAVVYVVFMGLLKNKRFDRTAVLSLLIIALVTEICVGDVSNYVMQQPKENYVNDYASYQEISRAVENEDEDLFYRTELTKLRTRMDPCWYGYNGVSTFSSMAYEHVAKLMDKLGMFGNDINSYTYNPQTPVFNSMFALKYLYDNGSLLGDNEYYDQVAQNEYFTAYEYQYPLPLAFAVDERLTEWSLDLGDPFAVQSDMIEKATGVADLFVTAEVTDVAFDNIENNIDPAFINNLSSFNLSKINSGSDGTFTAYMDIAEKGHYYVYTGSTRVSTLSITADDYNYSYSSSASQPLVLDLGALEAGTQVVLRYTLSDNNDASVDFSAVRIDSDKFRQAYKIIQSNGLLTLDSFDETSFSGTINVKDDNMLLYTSIPYDESWNVYVDGQRVSYGSGDIVKIGDALLGVKLPSGAHTVEMRYRARGFSTGLKLTALGILLVALMLVWKYYLADSFGKKHPVRLAQSPDWYIK